MPCKLRAETPLWVPSPLWTEQGRMCPESHQHPTRPWLKSSALSCRWHFREAPELEMG